VYFAVIVRVYYEYVYCGCTDYCTVSQTSEA